VANQRIGLTDEEIAAAALVFFDADITRDMVTLNDCEAEVRRLLALQRERIVEELIGTAMNYKANCVPDVHRALCDFADRLEREGGSESGE